MKKVKTGLLLLSTIFPSFLRLFLWRRLGFRVGIGSHVFPFAIVVAEYIDIGPGVVIKPSAFIYGLKKLILGERVAIGYFVRIIGYGTCVFGSQSHAAFGCLIDATTEFRIGDRSGLAPRGTYYTHGNTGLTCVKGHRQRNGPITIGKDCHVGIGCIVYPKVKIGDGTVVFAGLTIASDLPPNKAVVPSPEAYRLMPLGIVSIGVNEQECLNLMEEAFHKCAQVHPKSLLILNQVDRWELQIPRKGRVIFLRNDSEPIVDDDLEPESTVVWRLKRNGQTSPVPTFEFDELIVSGGWTPFADTIAHCLVMKSGIRFAFEDRPVK